MTSLGAVFALQDGLVGVLDHGRLARGLHDVVQLHVHVLDATRALQHLRSARTGLEVLPNPSSLIAAVDALQNAQGFSIVSKGSLDQAQLAYRQRCVQAGHYRRTEKAGE